MNDEKYQKARKDFEKISTPETLRRNLINASLLLTAYELMKCSIVDHVRSFYEGEEFENEIEEIRKRLTKELRKPLLIYALWFKDHKALSEGDFENIVKIWRYRNKIAHELIEFLVDSDFEVDMKYIFEIRDIVAKAEIWCVKEMEIPVNPDFDQVEVKDSDIRSGRMSIIDHLISVALEMPPGIENNKSNLVH